METFKGAKMLSPKKKRLKDYHFCFFGHEFKQQKDLSRNEVRGALEDFLKSKKMQIGPFVESGKWLWSGLIKGMLRSAFCVFETETGNRNVHIELGYALAIGLNVILIIPDKNGGYQKYLPSDLSDLIQMRYKDIEDLKSQLRTEIPKRYYSVEERLSLILQNASPTERTYFNVILEKKEVKFSDLAAWVRAKAMLLSENLSLADFFRKYDEVLEIKEENQLEGCLISVDKDYEDWICKQLGCQKGP